MVRLPLRPGWSKDDYFNSAWQDSIAPTLGKYLAGATIQVFLPGTGESVFDPETGEYTYPNNEVIVYEGPARVQPRRSTQEKSNNSTDATVQAVQFQVALPIRYIRTVADHAVLVNGEDGDYYTVQPYDVFARDPKDVRPKHRVRVIECEKNPVLESYEYVVFEVVDSSNPVEQTFWARVDQEVTRG